jgi:hypothetical protein
LLIQQSVLTCQYVNVIQHKISLVIIVTLDQVSNCFSFLCFFINRVYLLQMMVAFYSMTEMLY